MKKDLAIRALDMAVQLRCISRPKAAFFTPIAAANIALAPKAYGLCPSMNGNGNCYDNSAIKTFFKSLKAEMIWRQRWPTRRQAEADIFEYLNNFYNPRQRHSCLGGINPLAF